MSTWQADRRSLFFASSTYVGPTISTIHLKPEFVRRFYALRIFVLRGLSCDIGRTVGPDASGPLEYE
jgi:hypothetical protein